MRSLIAVAAILASAATSLAETPRMNSLEFSRAVECLAYAEFEPLKANGPDLSALSARFAAELAQRPTNTRNEVRDDMRRFRAGVGRPSSDQDIERVSALRDRACRRFVDETTTAANPAVAPASP